MANEAPHGCTNPAIGSQIRAYLDLSMRTMLRTSFEAHIDGCRVCGKVVKRATNMGMATPPRDDAPWLCTDPDVGRYMDLFTNRQLREPRLSYFKEHAVGCGSCSELVRDRKRRGFLR